MRMSRWSLLAAPLILAAGPALAHGPWGGGACRQDVAKLCAGLTPTPAPGPGNCMTALCPNMTPGPGGFASCLLNTYGSSLSPQCTQQLNQMKARIAARDAAFNTACSGDVSRFCSNVTSGPWVQMQCLHQAMVTNQQVSGNCQTFLAQHHGPGPEGHGPGGRGPGGPRR